LTQKSYQHTLNLENHTGSQEVTLQLLPANVLNNLSENLTNNIQQIYRIEGKFGTGLNLTIAKICQFFSQPNFIFARYHPYGEYDIHEKEGPAELPLTH